MKKYIVVLKVYMSDVIFDYKTLEILCASFTDIPSFVDDYIRDFDLFPDHYCIDIFQVTLLFEIPSQG